MKIPGLRLVQKGRPEATVQDDGPVGFISQSAIEGLKAGKRVQNWILPRKSEHADYCEMSVPIYTRPDNSGLRKAAEEALWYLSLDVDKPERGQRIEANLRAALEGK